MLLPQNDLIPVRRFDAFLGLVLCVFFSLILKPVGRLLSLFCSLGWMLAQGFVSSSIDLILFPKEDVSGVKFECQSPNILGCANSSYHEFKRNAFPFVGITQKFSSIFPLPLFALSETGLYNCPKMSHLSSSI